MTKNNYLAHVLRIYAIVCLALIFYESYLGLNPYLILFTSLTPLLIILGIGSFLYFKGNKK